LAAIVTLAAYWVFRNGFVLYYGDAQCHLNLSRSIIDSRTPGYDQIGTVWLPILHVICLPFVGSMQLWSTGLAGTIPVACCFVVAGTAFYLAARQTYRSCRAAWVVILCLALNPNLLYLGSIPMTEVVFLAGLAALLLSLVRFELSRRWGWIALGVGASWWMSLTRYDGWFLIPFAAVWFAWSAKRNGWLVFLIFGGLASLAPAYWVAHNWWETGNALAFYNGPYSAIAIQGDRLYPGYHNWLLAFEYYVKAGQLCAGWTLFLLGIAGAVCAFVRGVYRPVLFLLLTPAFYTWSVHSSKNPIFVPQLPPHGYYNSRYGIAVVAFAAFASGALVISIRARWAMLATVVPALAMLPWVLQPSKENWICWKESQVNSEARRAWTKLGADFMEAHYQAGQGILTPSASDDLTGIYCRARIPLHETINVGNGPIWMANTSRPLLIHEAEWLVDQQNDEIFHAVSPYRQVLPIQVKGAPVLRIEKRIPDAALH
jgi:hypothetical protein